MIELEPGLYEVLSPVYIRREPRVIEYLHPITKKIVTNRVGALSEGDQRRVYSVITEKDNSTWGRISAADGAGVAQWICMKNVNREFVKRVPVSIPESDIAERLARLEAWAEALGYER